MTHSQEGKWLINKFSKIMVHVLNHDQAVHFWTEKMGFQVLSEEDNGQGMRWIEIAPSEDSATSIVLHDKTLIAELEPEMNLGTPSLMFFTENAEQLYKDLANKQVKVGEIVELPTGKVFNFSDDEENYFAVSEKR